MKRKTFINNISLFSGAAVLLPVTSLLHSCEYKPSSRVSLTTDDIPFLDEIGETIIPASDDVPGAKAAGIGNFMYQFYNDCMKPEDQEIFLNGLNTIDALTAEKLEASFMDITAEERLALFEGLQQETIEYYEEQEGKEEVLPHYFGVFKGLTTHGYFTSEVGMTMARNYLPIPGKYEACIPYNPGDRPWAL